MSRGTSTFFEGIAVTIYTLTKDALLPIAATKFDAEGIYERSTLQRLLKQSVDALGEGLMVIAEEFCDWADSNRRIDLLALDTDANLVVVELKRTDDGGYMDLQAIRYAAMVSPMTFRQLVEAHARDRNPAAPDFDAAQSAILQFLGWSSADEEQFGNEVRIILASADFGKELTTSVIWLRERGIDIQCIRLRPYRMQDGTVLLDVQPIIPLPEVAEFQTQIGVKKQAERQTHSDRDDLRLKFWTDLLSFAKTRTDLHLNRKPSEAGWVAGGIGKAGFSITYAARKFDSQVELWIAFGPGRDQDNLRAFKELEKHKAQIESVFGEALEWQELPESAGCRVRRVIQGGYRSPQDQWPQIHANLVDAMIRLDKAMRPFVHAMAV